MPIRAAARQCSGRTCLDEQRLSIDQLIADLKGSGKDARFIPQVDDIVSTVVKEARAGDLVVVMSNGGFDDIHHKLLTGLEARPRRSNGRSHSPGR